MPVYEYRCESCGKRFSKLVGVTADSNGDPECPKCGGSNAKRLVSKFQRLRGDDERLDAFEDAALAGGDDPRTMSRLMKEMGKELGDDGEDSMDEYIEEAERDIYEGASDMSGAEG